jgi:hypothetical protein
MENSYLNKSEIINFVSMIMEQLNVNLNDYEDNDFVEVFVKHFRPWIQKHHGDEVSEYPMSYLVKLYMEDFAKDLNIETERMFRSAGANTLRKMSGIGREIVAQGKHQLKSLSKEGTFLEKYGKKLNKFIEHLDLPEIIKVDIQEPTPYRVNISFNIDFDKILKYQGNIPDINSVRKEIINFIENFLGLDLGRTSHGGLNLAVDHYPTFEGRDEWVEKVFKKSFKKDIKNAVLDVMGTTGGIHAMKFEHDTYSQPRAGKIKIIFNRDVSWTNEQRAVEVIKNYLVSQGYNLRYLDIANYH